MRCHSAMKNSLFRMERNDMATMYKIGGGHKESKRVGKYMVEIQDNESDYIIYFWSLEDKPCLTISVDKHDRTATIDQAEYRSTCTIDGRMERGDGTKEMIRFALDFLKKNGVVSVDLQDKSTVKCGDVEARLGVMYFFKYGCTWYEKHFGFKPTPEHTASYEYIKEIRKNIPELEELKKKDCSFYDKLKTTKLLEKYGLKIWRNFAWRLYL